MTPEKKLLWNTEDAHLTDEKMPHRINSNEGTLHLNKRKQYTTEEAIKVAEERAEAKAESRKVGD